MRCKQRSEQSFYDTFPEASWDTTICQEHLPESALVESDSGNYLASHGTMKGPGCRHRVLQRLAEFLCHILLTSQHQAIGEGAAVDKQAHYGTLFEPIRQGQHAKSSCMHGHLQCQVCQII